MLIGIVGHAGAGKDTAANYLRSQHMQHQYKIYHFAAPLKEVCAAAFNIDIKNFSDPFLKEEQHPYWNRSPRSIAQFVGTELFRNHVDEDHWLKLLDLKFILDFESTNQINAIVADVRFPNEIKFIIDRGGYILHIVRPGKLGKVGIQNHTSEQDLSHTLKTIDKERYILCTNDSTIEHLHSKVNQAHSMFIHHTKSNLYPL